MHKNQKKMSLYSRTILCSLEYVLFNTSLFGRRDQSSSSSSVLSTAKTLRTSKYQRNAKRFDQAERHQRHILFPQFCAHSYVRHFSFSLLEYPPSSGRKIFRFLRFPPRRRPFSPSQSGHMQNSLRQMIHMDASWHASRVD